MHTFLTGLNSSPPAFKRFGNLIREEQQYCDLQHTRKRIILKQIMGTDMIALNKYSRNEQGSKMPRRRKLLKLKDNVGNWQ